MEDNNNLGILLKQKRKEKGFTLEQIGDYVGVQKATVSRWERGLIRDMKRNRIDALCNILDISPTFFVKGFINEDKNQSFTREQYKVNVINMTNNCTELSKEEKKIITSIMNTL